MADYQPLISRAVAGLESNTGENRRALYERARAALVKQLRSVDPPLEESDITRERLALEEAIRKIEAEELKGAPAGEAQAAPEKVAGERGLRGILNASVAEAEGLGGAAAEARRSAEEFYRQVPSGQAFSEGPPPATHYFEPHETEPYEADAVYESRPRGRTQALPEGAPPAPPPYEEHDEAYAPAPRAWGRIAAIAVVVLVVAALAGIGFWQRHTISALVAGFHAAPVKTQQAKAPASVQPKITDRVQETNAEPKTAPTAAVAQKVVLYEEDPTNPKGKRYVGSAIWRTETVSPGSGLAPELAVRADVEIPERHMRMTFSLRRNTDKALPASHTIEVQFTLPADFDQGGIGNVPGVWMKESENGQDRGVPLAGLSVKVTNGYFLIGLSAAQVDKERNIDLMKQRDWLEIPIVYTSGRRAILALEKGTPGERAFAEAFRAWGE